MLDAAVEDKGLAALFKPRASETEDSLDALAQHMFENPSDVHPATNQYEEETDQPIRAVDEGKALQDLVTDCEAVVCDTSRNVMECLQLFKQVQQRTSRPPEQLKYMLLEQLDCTLKPHTSMDGQLKLRGFQVTVL